MLAMGQRTNKDPRTLGSLFHAGCDELRQVRFAEVLTMLPGLFQQVLKGIQASIAERIQVLLDLFVAGIPAMCAMDAANFGVEILGFVGRCDSVRRAIVPIMSQYFLW